MLRFFRGLRGQLILTYTLVTVLALLALEVAALLAFGLFGYFAYTLSTTNTSEYFYDITSVLAPQARAYLLDDDRDGLQAWLESVHASGLASLPPQYTGDSPAAPLVQGYPLYALSPDGIVLAQAPPGEPSLVGQSLPPDTPSYTLVQSALVGVRVSPSLYAPDTQGNYVVAVPVTEAPSSSDLAGVLVLTVAPPPNPGPQWLEPLPVFLRYAPTVVWIILGTAVVLLVAVAPFGALFGLIMSRGLTRRLGALSRAAEAWSEGNFAPLPDDRRQDEIGDLARRLRRMAERVQSLLQAQQELAALEERNRLARELHDTVKQQSFATLMQVRAARNLLAQSGANGDAAPAAQQRLAEAEGLLKTSQQELSRLIAELRPAALDGQGLVPALKHYAETWSQHAGIPISVHVQNERSLPLETEQALYRVAQEALANVARHSQATAATVRLAFAHRHVTLTVTDNGRGFDPQAVSGGFGLRSMRERLEALGGWLSVDGAAGGTTLTASAPTGEPAA